MAFNYKKISDNVILVHDPIYKDIIIPYPYSKIIETKEMMRLQNIVQTGFTKYEYSSMQNNDRLSHSVGTFYIMTKFLKRLENILSKYNLKLSYDDIEVSLTAMLLHDIGHGSFSHSLECVTNYSHEQRTSDIILGDTNIHHLLISLFGQEKVLKIASFISKINDEKIVNDSFTKLLNNLVSYQLDADRLDYLIRDSYYVGITPTFNLDKIINSMNISVNNKGEYELVFERNGLANIENVLIQRFQMYRDIYLCPLSCLGDYLFSLLIQECEKKDLNNLNLPIPFQKFIKDKSLSNLKDFLEINDKNFEEAFQIIKENSSDELLRYLANFNNIKDYYLFNNQVNMSKLYDKLSQIFEKEIKHTNAIIKLTRKAIMYKKEESLRIKNHNKIQELIECSNLIKLSDKIEDEFCFFNPEILRIELGMSKKEYLKYERKIINMIKELDKEPVEFELKYCVDDSNNVNPHIITAFIENGFKLTEITEEKHDDNYYDTKDLSLYKSDSSLRIRVKETKNDKKINGTYKTPFGISEVYSTRYEYEENLSDTNFYSLKEKLLHLNIINIDDILSIPIINNKTNRINFVLEKNNIPVCLSIDSCSYHNNLLNNETSEVMIEIEAMGEVDNRIILNEIHEFLEKAYPNLVINKQSKYERAINSTFNLVIKNNKILKK